MLGAIRLDGNLAIRPARDEDGGFIEALYGSTRDDLRQIDADRDFIEELILIQHRAQISGYSTAFPNAFYFIVEHLGERIGRVAVDFGDNEVHIIDIAFIPKARGKGFGGNVIKALQYAAAQVKAPLSLSVYQANFNAKRFYLGLGFQVEHHDPMVARMVWHPLPN